MARRKKKKARTKKTSFKLGTSKSRKRQRINWQVPSFPVILKISAVVCILAAVGAGFVFLEKYVKKAVGVSEKTAHLELVDVPYWVNEQLKEKIYTAAKAGGEDLKLDENAAASVQQNIEAQVAWLDEVQVQTTHDRLLIKASWRRPLALVRLGLQKFYVDEKLVVLDFVPVPGLAIVAVEGLSARSKPSPGEIRQGEDLAAAVAILARLEKMDRLVTPDKPLLHQIARINVSNFNGRRSSRAPHIVLYTTDDTEIIWGAEIGTWQRHLEATDEEKLAKLYSYYKQHGTLLEGVKYINLRDPQEKVSQPVDKR